MAEPQMTQEQMIAAQKAQCPFCKIIAGEIPSKKVFEDEHMIAILDINPATKGHLLVMPKEHYPILPLIPPEVFAHLFRTTQQLITATNKGIITPRSTLFMANGGAAGQQSPHFLYHIIPREDNDGLDQLDVQGGDIDQVSLQQSLQQNMQAIMKNHLARQGLPGQTGTSTPVTGAAPDSAPVAPETLEDKFSAFLNLLQQEPQLQDLLMNNPEQLKQLIAQNPTLNQAFSGLDLEKVRKVIELKNTAPEATTPTEVEVETIQETVPESLQEPPQELPQEPSHTNLQNLPPEQNQERPNQSVTDTAPTLPAKTSIPQIIPPPDVPSHLEHVQEPASTPQDQEPTPASTISSTAAEQESVPDAAQLSATELREYIDRKPVLKQLLFEDMDRLHELLQTHERLQQFFKVLSPEQVKEKLASFLEPVALQSEESAGKVMPPRVTTSENSQTPRAKDTQDYSQDPEVQDQLSAPQQTKKPVRKTVPKPAEQSENQSEESDEINFDALAKYLEENK